MVGRFDRDQVIGRLGDVERVEWESKLAIGRGSSAFSNPQTLGAAATTFPDFLACRLEAVSGLCDDSPHHHKLFITPTDLSGMQLLPPLCSMDDRSLGQVPYCIWYKRGPEPMDEIHQRSSPALSTPSTCACSSEPRVFQKVRAPFPKAYSSL